MSHEIGTVPEITEPSAREARISQYRAAVEMISALPAERLYPEGVTPRAWERLNDDAAAEHLGAAYHRGVQSALSGNGAYRSDAGEIFLVPVGKSVAGVPGTVTQVYLDAIAAARERFPWAPVNGLVYSDDEHDQWMEDELGTYYVTYRDSAAMMNRAMAERIVTGLGDRYLTDTQRQGAMAWLIAKLAHESVHMAQNPDLAMGGHTVNETSAVAAELLAFPGTNTEGSELIQRGVAILERMRPPDGDLYGRAALLASLILAELAGFLPPTDDAGALGASVREWKAWLEELDEPQLAAYRRQAEAALIAGSNDELARAAIARLVAAYPISLGIYEWDPAASLDRRDNVPENP